MGLQTDGSTELMMVRALNEFDSKLYSNGINWRQKIDSQKGAVLATELKNNSFKVAKWVISAHLAGADVIKVCGYNLSCVVDALTSVHHCVCALVGLCVARQEQRPAQARCARPAAPQGR